MKDLIKTKVETNRKSVKVDTIPETVKTIQDLTKEIQVDNPDFTTAECNCAIKTLIEEGVYKVKHK